MIWTRHEKPIEIRLTEIILIRYELKLIPKTIIIIIQKQI